MEMGNTILLKYKDNPSGVLIIDEIGPLELEVGGWATMLNQLVGIPQYKMIWVVRRGALADVINKWNLKDPLILDISNIRISQAKEIILAFLS
jgi:nucleoside-triphosphatase THEP1